MIRIICTCEDSYDSKLAILSTRRKRQEEIIETIKNSKEFKLANTGMLQLRTAGFMIEKLFQVGWKAPDEFPDYNRINYLFHNDIIFT